MFKKGDKVKFVENDKRIPKYYADNDGIPADKIIHGSTGLGGTYYKEFAKIVGVYNEFYIVRWTDSSNKIMQLGFKEESLELIAKQKTFMSTLKEKMILLVTPEPMKSRRKAGITDGDDYPTEDGMKAIISWWLKNSPDAEKFDNDVVKPIIKEMEKEN